MRNDLIKSAKSGSILDMRPKKRFAARHRGLKNVSASCIRSLLLGRSGGILDPRGVRLRGARIIGQLDLSDVRFELPLHLMDCHFDEFVILERASMSSLSFRGSNMPGLRADGLRVNSDFSLDDVTVTGHSKDGAVRLQGARIAGQLSARHAVISNHAGPALHADNLGVGEMLVLDNLVATGHSKGGAVRLPEAHIVGQLSMSSAKIENYDGPAVQADGLAVNAPIMLNQLKATAHTEDGAVRLLNARITGELNLVKAILGNELGPCLAADGLHVDGNIVVGGLNAAGHGELGTVRLVNVQCRGRLSVRGARTVGATLTNRDGPALRADRIRVESDVFLADLTAKGSGKRATLRFPGAHIAGDLTVNGAVTAVGEQRELLDLQHAKVDGQLSLFHEPFWQDAFDQPNEHRPRLLLNGFTYAAKFKKPRPETWLKVLQTCMPHYVPQPYRQLAEALGADGDEEQAKRVLIAQQDALHATLSGWWARVGHRVSGMTVRYGYRSGRALAGLVCVLAISWVVMVVAATFGVLVHSAKHGSIHCGVVESLGEALNRTVPLLRFSVYGNCELTRAKPAQAVYLGALLLQALGWAFLTLFVAGFTGIIRKPNA
ncbi:hypothetical protein ACWCQ1_46040 [Streptomyces sp. NPDC002144]